MATRKISISDTHKRGEKIWIVRYWREGKVRRPAFKSKAEAEAEAKRVRELMDDGGTAWFDLPAVDRRNLMMAYHESSLAGIDIFKAIHSARETGGVAVMKSPTVKAVICEMVVAKRQSGRDVDYANGLETTLFHLLKGLELQRIDKISLAQVETILNSKTLASRSTVRARLSTLFEFARRKGYRLDNPCERVEPITYHKPPPKIFTVAQMRMAVAWLREHAPHGLAWFALSTFCGLRPEEGEKTLPNRDIDFKAGLIRVEKQTTKVRQRRVVYPRAEALKFLKWTLRPATGGELPLAPQNRKRILSGVKRTLADGTAKEYLGLRKALGWQRWPADVTRHTAASYWLAGGASPGDVSEALGNSEKVLKRDYRALVTRAEAEEFWKVVKELAK